MTENGGVNRGICRTENGLLSSVIQCKDIAYNEQHCIVYKDEENAEHTLDENTPVSMNMWGFTPDYFDLAIREFKSFLLEKIDVPKSEQVIPDVADAIIKSGEATIKVLDTESKWFGVTYAEDRLTVVNKLIELHKNKVYPEKLF